ncbi:MAG: response regulator [Bdellovibrionota bacterium]|nr:response regulator [Bdellovibrionota bacterium]
MRVLIIEDDQDFKETLRDEFKENGFAVEFCDDTAQIQHLKDLCTHAVVDLRLKTKSGLDFIPVIREKFPDIKMTMLTAFGSVATSVKAIKLGADNYIMKPCTFKELMVALDCGNLEQESQEEIPGLYKKEREYIEYVLDLYDGNISKAAESLGIRRQSLQRKLKKYPPRK